VKGNPPLPPIDLLLIWLVAQAGRQTGSLILYYSAALGLGPLRKFYGKFIEPRVPRRQFIPACIMKQITNPSPFSVAIGRLIGLRIPMAITMSARQKLSHLSLGVLLSSIVWDGIYLIIGSTVGAAVVPKPQYMLLYSLGGLTVLYMVTLGVRFLLRKRAMKNKSTS
jgi:membrane protein DedA with SNARE-associated domain